MKAPYFINPDIDALADATGDARLMHIRRIAANVGDEATLRALLGLDPEEFSSFYPDLAKPQLSTGDTIDTFISQFSTEKAAAATEIEDIVGAPAIDYAAMLDDGDDTGADAPDDATSDLISNFLHTVPAPSKKTKKAAQTEPPTKMPTDDAAVSAERTVNDDETLSEALFKLMVKNRNYTKALEIITELSLNNPKKSIYFAYQISFLKKLIKNQENSRQNGNKVD